MPFVVGTNPDGSFIYETEDGRQVTIPAEVGGNLGLGQQAPAQAAPQPTAPVAPAQAPSLPAQPPAPPAAPQMPAQPEGAYPLLPDLQPLPGQEQASPAVGQLPEPPPPPPAPEPAEPAPQAKGPPYITAVPGDTLAQETSRRTREGAEVGIAEAEAGSAQSAEEGSAQLEEYEKGIAEVGAKAAADAALLHTERAARVAAEAAALKKAREEGDREVEEAERAVRADDPGRAWRNAHIWQKAMFLVSAFMGGLVTHLHNGKNIGLEMLNQFIERDIEAQRSEREVAEKKLARAMGKSTALGEQVKETLAIEEMGWVSRLAAIEEVAKAELQKYAGTAAEAAAKQRLAQIRAELANRRIAAKERVSKERLEWARLAAQMRGSGGKEEPKPDVELRIQTPTGHFVALANNPLGLEENAKFRGLPADVVKKGKEIYGENRTGKLVENIANLQDFYDVVATINHYGRGWKVLPDARKRTLAAFWKGVIMSESANIEGVPSDKDIENLKGALGNTDNPEEIFNILSKEARAGVLVNIRQRRTNALNSKLSTLFGVELRGLKGRKDILSDMGEDSPAASAEDLVAEIRDGTPVAAVHALRVGHDKDTLGPLDTEQKVAHLRTLQRAAKEREPLMRAEVAQLAEGTGIKNITELREHYKQQNNEAALRTIDQFMSFQKAALDLNKALRAVEGKQQVRQERKELVDSVGTLPPD